jgi:hypothetical protein
MAIYQMMAIAPPIWLFKSLDKLGKGLYLGK